MTTDNHDSTLWALRDAQECLREYQAYGEAMRQYGRGFHPVAKDGASIDTVQARIRAAIAQAEEAETDDGLNHPDHGIATMPGEDMRTSETKDARRDTRGGGES